ncbi:MAG: polysaccharide deacetylase family protein [Bryobacteraceae bacterium]
MPRADALATLYFFHPLRKLLGSSRSGVPILMYHSVSDRPPDAKHPYFQTITTPAVFAEHMSFLREHGFSSVSLNQAVEHMHAPNTGPTKPVVITFDDGYRDFRTNAFPILEKHRFSATVFLPTGLIGDPSQTFKGFDILTWSEVRDLHAAGVQFGSHTVTHPQLRSLDWKAIQFEVQTSKDTIEDRLGSAVSSFSYPYAFPEADRPFTQRLQEVLSASGYANGVSTVIGTANQRDNKYFLKRLPVNSADGLPLLNAKLTGGYDWLHGVQHASKRLKANALA